MINERLIWLKSIYPEFEDKESFYENVYRPEDLKYYDFFNRKKQYKEYINPENIVGIRYAWAYNSHFKINWHQLLRELHRLKHVIENFKSKEEVINHIHHNYSEQKYVLKYGNHYFTIGGQHRLCLAKFLNLKSVEVNVTEYELDKSRLVQFKKLKTAIKRLSKYGLVWDYSFEEMAEASKYEYMYLGRFKTSIRIKINLLSQFIDYYEQYYVFRPLYKIQLFLNDFLYPNRIGMPIEISEIKDFKKANYSIVLHKMKKK